jgi:hypothetical protein
VAGHDGAGGVGRVGDLRGRVEEAAPPFGALREVVGEHLEQRDELPVGGVRALPGGRDEVVEGGPVGRLQDCGHEPVLAAEGVVGTGENHWSAVHVDDLADLYLLALEALAGGGLAPGTLLQPAAAPTFSMRALADAVAEGTGVGRTASWTVEEADAASPLPFATLYASEMRLDASRSRTLLGWNPTRPSLLEDLAHGSYADAARRRAAPLGGT